MYVTARMALQAGRVDWGQECDASGLVLVALFRGVPVRERAGAGVESSFVG